MQRRSIFGIRNYFLTFKMNYDTILYTLYHESDKEMPIVIKRAETEVTYRRPYKETKFILVSRRLN